MVPNVNRNLFRRVYGDGDGVSYIAFPSPHLCLHDLILALWTWVPLLVVIALWLLHKHLAGGTERGWGWVALLGGGRGREVRG